MFIIQSTVVQRPCVSIIYFQAIKSASYYKKNNCKVNANNILHKVPISFCGQTFLSIPYNGFADPVPKFEKHFKKSSL